MSDLMVVADTDFEQTEVADAPVRYWAADFTVWGAALDGSAIERITAAWIAAVEAEGALMAGGIAEIDANGIRLGSRDMGITTNDQAPAV